MVINTTGGNVITPPPDNILQSFPDAIAGRSIITYQGAAAEGNQFVLTPDGGTSYPLEQSSTSSYNLNFDITINKATIFAGLCTLDIRAGASVGAGSATYTFVFAVIHYDGSTETEIGTATFAITTSSGEQRKVKLSFDITRKIFKIGDILRLELDASRDGGASTVFHHDPNVAGNECILRMPVVNLE